ncbi:MAG TPA: aminopeptidase [Clostridiales bacterium]|nr:aminopeptidase [Clostridiales bacterium]
MDPRLTKLAQNLVNYSCSLKKGEKIYIEAYDIDYMLVNEIIKEVYKVGGLPFVSLYDTRVQRQLLLQTTQEHSTLRAKYAKYLMSDMDAYIGIRGANNTFELSDVPAEKMGVDSKYYAFPVHHEIRVAKTKWVILRYPNPSMAQASSMSTDEFEDLYFKVCNLDYSKMDKAMDNLKAYIEKTDKVRLVTPTTDLTFSIKNIPAIKCSGQRNIPDGEVYTAPIKDSVNGVIEYNAPSMHQGLKHEKVRLVVKNGKIIEATSNHTEALNKVLDTDEGSRYFGEFSFGLNPYITKPTGDILFDEKISGSIHFTPGASYDEAFNGNTSAVHWDLVLIMTPEYGGGEIYMDGKLIRKDGRFVVKELECLNPENLL